MMPDCETEDTAVTIECSRCEATRASKPRMGGGVYVPRGWWEHGGEVLCPACKAEQYITRVVSLPVAAPLDGEWKDLRAALRRGWRESRMISNAAVQELFRTEPAITPGTERMPKPPKVDLYSLMRARFPEFPTGSLCALLKRVTAVYLKERFQRAAGRETHVAELPPGWGTAPRAPRRCHVWHRRE